MSAYKRLRARFACFCAIGTSCVVIALAFCTYLYSAKQIVSQAEKIFRSECNSILHSLDAREKVTPDLLSHMEDNHNLFIELEPHQEGTEASPARNEYLLESDEGNFRVCVAKLAIGDRWVDATIARNRSDEYAQFARLRFVFGGMLLVTVGILAAASWFYSAWAVRPLTEDFRNQNEFLFAIAHELRTPLSVIQMNAENIAKASEEDAEQFVRTIMRESKRIGRVTKDLLELTHALRNGWSICRAPQNPGYILLTAYESYELAAQKKGISLQVITPDYILPQIDCDLSRMQQVLAVLMDNAMQYTPPGGKIILQVQQQRKHIAFIVTDSGVGIPDDKRSKVFEKFYRGDAAGTNHDHYGLGLYLAMEFVLLHQGELLVEDSPLGGARFIARIPFIPPNRTIFTPDKRGQAVCSLPLENGHEK